MDEWGWASVLLWLSLATLVFRRALGYGTTAQPIKLLNTVLRLVVLQVLKII
jgi:hypothetical protein